VLHQPGRLEAADLAARVATLLTAGGLKVWAGTADDDGALPPRRRAWTCSSPSAETAPLCAPCAPWPAPGVPILGVNLGRLGFLAEVEPGRVLSVIPALLRGEYAIEERMMVRAELVRGERVIWQADAINEVVLARGRVARSVDVSVEVDGRHMITFTADGVMVAGPTGSTAYSLAAGGPIVAPDLDCLIITPIAAHLTIARSIVIPAGRRLCRGYTRGYEATLTADGHADVSLEPGDRIYHSASPVAARFVRLGGDGYFYETVLRRLRWPRTTSTP
jgi:NAD+ kinase